MRTRNSTCLSWFFALFLIVAPSICPAATTHVYGGIFNLPIPAEANLNEGRMDDAVIDVTEHLIISDLDVAIDITHTNVFDLQIILENPSGLEIYLNAYYDMNDFAIYPNYSQTIFDDEAALPIEQGKAPFIGRFRPMSGNYLSDFDGTDAFGQWRLRIDDLYLGDKGYLENFELMITVPEPATLVLFALSGFLLRRRN